MKIIKQVAKRLNEPYYDMIKKVRTSKVVYVDETGYKVNGKQWWLWTFVCNDCILFVIRKSRSKKIIEEILGRGFNGIISCDGWKTYEKFSDRLQRCWAHLLRESHYLKEEHKDYENYHNQIKGKLVDEMKIKLLAIAFKMEKEVYSKKLATKIKNELTIGLLV